MNNEKANTDKMEQNENGTAAKSGLKPLLPAARNVVYNLDCMEYLTQYEDNHFDLAIVDPPYGNSSDVMKPVSSDSKYQAKRSDYKKYDNNRPPQKYFDELMRVSKDWIIWGGNYFFITGGVIVWQKNGTAFGEGEIAICSTHNSVRFFEFTWNGMIQGDMKNKEQRIHVHQKPVKLYDWLIKNYAKDAKSILDTHVGSGSSRIAAYKAGKKFTGFEIDKDHWLAQEERFNNFKRQLTLF